MRPASHWLPAERLGKLPKISGNASSRTPPWSGSATSRAAEHAKRPRYRVLRRARVPTSPVIIRQGAAFDTRATGALRPGAIMVCYETRGDWVRISPWKSEWVATRWTSPTVGEEDLLERL